MVGRGLYVDSLFYANKDHMSVRLMFWTMKDYILLWLNYLQILDDTFQRSESGRPAAGA